MKSNFEKIFNSPYDLNLFAKEVLNPVFGSNFQMNMSPVPASVELNKSESNVISKVLIYGKIELEDLTEITCYEIHLHENSKIEYSKVAIQRYVRKLLGNGQAALINFVNPANKNIWRFTYIANERTINEKGERVSKLVNSKRYTYLLGTYESCKTAAERFDILSKEQSITMETLTKAFSVEKLSKSFFDEYLRHYDNFVAYLTNSNFKTSVFSGDEKAIRDFSKKLLGRIVFLYFVQKKGWLGATDLEYKDGLQNFMTEFYNLAGANDAFYNNFLKTLFFETLNKSRKNDDFEMPNGTLRKIPFLNGGLFDKEKVDENILTFKPELFHSLWDEDNPKMRGFLDFLNAYNFTVYEDSPDEETVAVDPEMLGHIFENLLEDNKDKGAYYTPKEIVHYMCQESLSEYLLTNYKLESSELQNEVLKESIRNLVTKKEVSILSKTDLQEIDALLDSVKICDPAIGSGAFPVGLLQEIFIIKEVIAYETDKEWKPAKVKEEIIQNSIYGVDIEKGAVDIARLRFWLSLVVDEEKPKALPNLDYKIVVGNSLVSKFEDEIIEIDWKLINNSALKQSRPDLSQRISENAKNIHTAQYEFFHSLTDKNALKLKIRNHKIDLLETLIEIEKQILKEKGINPANASNKKQTVEITERKIKYEGFNRMLDKLNNLKKHPDKPLNYFDWQLDFPEVLNPAISNGNGNPKNSDEVQNANIQIQILNKQIVAINQYLKQQNINEHILTLQTNIVHSQIALIKVQLEQIEKKISQIYGELFKVEGNIVKEPSLSFVYSIRPINQGIKEINQKVEKINPKLQKENTNSELGFDIVIGNPPYIRHERLKELKPFLENKYKVFNSTSDIYTYFYELSCNLCRNFGIVTYITSNKWMQTGYGKNLRNYFIENTKPIKLIDFGGYQVFENATVDTNIIILQKLSKPLIPFYVSACCVNESFNKFKSIFEYFENNKTVLKNLTNDSWTVSNDKSQIVKQKIENLGIAIKKWNIKINFGIKTGLTDAFIISTATKEKLVIADKRNAEILNPVLRGKDIKKYSINYSDLWLISTFPTRKIDIDKYPTIKEYFLNFGKSKLEQTGAVGSRKKSTNKWFETQDNIAFWKDFYQPKIVYQEIASTGCFCWDEDAFHVNQSCYIMVGANKYILSILNSKLITWFFKSVSVTLGEKALRWIKQYVEQIPIPKISETAQEPFIKIVDEIIEKKKNGIDTGDLERKIDEMVYELYELTAEEIKIVEGK